MSKSIKLKCTSSITKSFDKDRLYAGRVDDEGNVSVTRYCTAENKKKRVVLSRGVSGELFVSHDGAVAVTFVELKTKTLKCMRLIGPQQKGGFKPGKRYQVESGRALGGVAGYIFDEDGCRWTLYRAEVGFECTVALFEAKYL